MFYLKQIKELSGMLMKLKIKNFLMNNNTYIPNLLNKEC